MASTNGTQRAAFLHAANNVSVLSSHSTSITHSRAAQHLQDMSRVVNEQSELQQAVMEARENLVLREQESRREEAAHQAAIADLKFVESRKSARCDELERENMGLRKRLQNVMQTYPSGGAPSHVREGSLQMPHTLEASLPSPRHHPSQLWTCRRLPTLRLSNFVSKFND